MTTYYVSSQIGNDNNAGTCATAPLATLQVAANLVHPGDTVEVMNGTYTGPAYGDVLDITTSGTASAPITFEAAPGQTPIIDSSDCWNAINIKASYIIINGLTIVGDAAKYDQQYALANESPENATLDGNGIFVTGRSGNIPNHIIIENNTVYNEPGGGIGTAGADYVQILNNVVYNNANWSAYGNSGISVLASVKVDTASGPHMVISGNLVYNNAELVPWYQANAITDGEGIILDSNQGYTGGFLVQNNTVHDNGSAGIEAFLSDNAVITGNTIYNNNTQNVQTDPNSYEIFIYQSNNVTVSDNIFDPNHTSANPPVITGDTVDGSVVTLTGTAEASSTIKIYDDSTQLPGSTITSGLTLNSSYNRQRHPVNTLTVTATNSTAGETGTSAAQTITVTDPPADSSGNVKEVAIAFTHTAAALLAQFGAAGFQGGTNNGGPIGAPSQAHWTEDTSFLAKPHS
jgi:parallel beta-helix repeat protein